MAINYRVRFFLSGAFTLFLLTSFSQNTTLKGVVSDGKGEPLSYAHVYLEQTSKGAYTDANGYYSIEADLNGIYQLRASIVGYISKSIEVNLEGQPIIANDFKLAEEVESLNEIVVSGGRDRSWEKNLRKFQTYFFGKDETNFNNQCEIENSYVLDFREEGELLIATASEPLIIINQALGYSIEYELKSFLLNTKTSIVNYTGHSFFTELPAKDREEANEWLMNRTKLYFGSKLHFLRALTTSSLTDEGYAIYLENVPINALSLIKSSSDKPISEASIVSKIDPNTSRLRFANFLRVEYLKKQDAFYQGNRSYTFNETSWIRLNKTSTSINQKGFFIRPLEVVSYGAFGFEGIASALPFDFDAEQTVPVAEDIDRKKKFMDNLSRYDSLYIEEKVVLTFPNGVELNPGQQVKFEADFFIGIYDFPASLSEVLYVELIGPNCDLLDTKKVRVVENKAFGSIQVPPTLYSGNYEIRAYTAWMKNFDPAQFFSKEVQVGESNDAVGQVNFFPEYGRLVAGQNNQLTIQALNESGQPIATYIRVFDDRDRLVSEMSTNEYGIAQIMNFNPDDDRAYYALDVSSKLRWNLPSIAPNVSLGLGIIQTKDGVSVRLVNESSDDRTVIIAIESYGLIMHFANYYLAGKSPVLVVIENEQLRSGLNSISILDEEMNVLGEKTLFLEMDNEPTFYESNDQIDPEIKNYLKWNWSAKRMVYDTSFIDQDQNILNATLKATSWKKLDYKKIYLEDFPKLNHEVERGFTISGRLLGYRKDNELAITSGDLMLLVKDDNPKLLLSEVDSEGRFVFESVKYNDTTDLVFDYNGIKIDRFEVVIDTIDQSSFPPSIRCQDGIDTERNLENDFSGSGMDAIMLDAIEVKTERIKNSITERKNVLYSEADWSINFEEDINARQTIYVSGGVLEYLVGRAAGGSILRDQRTNEVTGFYFRGNASFDGPRSALFIYEGMSMSARDFNSLDPNMIGRIDVLAGPAAAAYGLRGAAGVIIAYASRSYENRGRGTSTVVRMNLSNGYSTSIFKE